MKGHKCEGCPFRGEHQEPGFRPFGVCCLKMDLAEAAKAYEAEKCWLENKEKTKKFKFSFNFMIDFIRKRR